jgi:hypothetical protein
MYSEHTDVEQACGKESQQGVTARSHSRGTQAGLFQFFLVRSPWRLSEPQDDYNPSATSD